MSDKNFAITVFIVSIILAVLLIADLPGYHIAGALIGVSAYQIWGERWQ